MTTAYAEFIRAKQHENAADGFAPTDLPDWLYPFQRVLTDWAIRQGRGLLSADCGTGKTPMQLVWADEVRRHTGKPVLVLTPLAVGAQTEREAKKFGFDAARSRMGATPAGMTITNYEQLRKFNPDDFGGVVCDESSILKSFNGVRRAEITEFVRRHRYRLLCTATAAPNDYIELGTSSEALGHLGYMDMLNRFFTNRLRSSAAYHGKYRVKDRDVWRFKGHAEEPFWRWVASWARAIRRPSDLGFDDAGFDLPPLLEREHIVEARTPPEDTLFTVPASGLREERAELRRTLTERCEMAAEVLASADRAVAWCHRNDEGDLLTNLIDGAVQVAGSDSLEAKEEALTAFGAGGIRVLVTKPQIAGWGLNWSHCHRMTYFPSHSFELKYQAVRRCWRFRQEHPVEVDIITTEGGRNTLANLRRKAAQADRMFDAMVTHMRHAATVDAAQFETKVEVPAWLT